MDIEARAKLDDGDYEQALLLYERILASPDKENENGKTFQLLLGKAQALILLLRYRDTVICYRKALPFYDLNDLDIMRIIESLLASLCRLNTSHESPDSVSIRSGKALCLICKGILIEPITSSSGRTHCMNCTTKIDNKNLNGCEREQNASEFKVNVTMQEIVSKYFKDEHDACRQRLLGNSSLKEGNIDQALEKYLEAIKIDPSDAPLNSNISHIMTHQGQFDKGLEYADIVCKVQPGWAKGYYRRGCALIGLKRKPEAAFAFFKCLACDQNNEVVKKLLKEIMQSIFTEGKENNFAMIQELMEIFEKSKDTDDIQGNMDKQPQAIKQNWDVQDFECTLCCRMFYEPVTTPCGHVFCRNCLNRSLDHRPDCPICRRSLSQILAARNQNVTEVIVHLLKTHLPDEFEERKKIHFAEMEQLASVASNTEVDIPIFVCTLAFPTVPCPLHIFEPRYRLMVRQCMESGCKQFGMCSYDDQTGFAEYGTMLEILDVQFLPDGRSLVNTIGGRRFKVLSKGKRDGYNTAKVEWIKDDPIPKDSEDKIKNLLREVHREANSWFSLLPILLRRKIISSFNEMPRWQDDSYNLPHGPEWLWWLITVCPLDPKDQLTLLAHKSLEQRLVIMRRVLASMM